MSSRRGLTDRWGSLVPPGHNQGHTGKWFEPLAPVRCGMSSSSHSGSQAGLDRSHFGTPLKKQKNPKKPKGRLMALSARCYCLWPRFSRVTCFLFHSSHEGRGENKINNTTSDLDAILPHIHREEQSIARRLMDLLCDHLTVWQNDGFHLRWTAFKYHLWNCRLEMPVRFHSDSHWNSPHWNYYKLSVICHSWVYETRKNVLLCTVREFSSYWNACFF